MESNQELKRKYEARYQHQRKQWISKLELKELDIAKATHDIKSLEEKLRVATDALDTCFIAIGRGASVDAIMPVIGNAIQKIKAP